MVSMNRRNDYNKKNTSMFIWAPDYCFRTDLKNCEPVIRATLVKVADASDHQYLNTCSTGGDNIDVSSYFNAFRALDYFLECISCVYIMILYVTIFLPLFYFHAFSCIKP